MTARLLIGLFCGLFCAISLASCGPEETQTQSQPRGIISLDFCADQYLMAFGDADAIIGLSPDSERSFSYYRARARGFTKIRPRAEDILIEKPGAVIRTFGGGPNITALLERVGIEVIQIPYANDLESIRKSAIETSAALGHPARGRAAVADMDRRLAALKTEPQSDILYLTSKGAVAGAGTLIDELIASAGHTNFEQRPGWRFAPLEQLAYGAPRTLAAGFFDGADANTDHWSPARHTVAKRALRDNEIVDIPGAWTACGAWFAVDAAEAMARAR